VLPHFTAWQPSENNRIYLCYYVNIFVDCDMMVRYHGGRVGHKSTCNTTNVFINDHSHLD
ncbi:hypothetical protein P691DRAFT_626875, partial [Macrolepiota fuliginosa MF-IS2]